jgi:hypothetical protein
MKIDPGPRVKWNHSTNRVVIYIGTRVYFHSTLLIDNLEALAGLDIVINCVQEGGQ